MVGAFAFVIILFLIGLVYIIKQFRRFSFVKKLSQKGKLWSVIASLIPILILVAFGYVNIYATIVVFLHLIIIWALCSLLGHIIRKIRKVEFKRNVEGVLAILITAVYMSFGWYYAHHVWETDYNFETAKDLSRDSLRVALVADSHLGATLDGEKFTNEMNRISETAPDVVIVAGDFVDDGSLKEDMIASCKALGNINTKYGVYFVFGNHDKGYGNYRNFDENDLREELEKNNVKILEDESVLVDNSFYIVGRQDRTEADRKSAEELTKDLDKSKYTIMADHQPNDYANEVKAGVDLILSGHTHGGHLFPLGPIGLLLKANDRIYGTETREYSTFVVTSGISGWAIPFKTGTFSEFVIIDIKKAS